MVSNEANDNDDHGDDTGKFLAYILTSIADLLLSSTSNWNLSFSGVSR